jgi:hypothetical protein
MTGDPVFDTCLHVLAGVTTVAALAIIIASSFRFLVWICAGYQPHGYDNEEHDQDDR